MDRASTFSDPTVIKKLQTEFIPVAGNVAELQWRRTPASKWYMEMAGKVNYRVRAGQTTQGFYAFAADGSAYAYDNVRDAKRVHNLLDEARDAFYKKPPAKVEIPKEELEAAFTSTPEASTSVIRVFTRVRPLPLGANEINKSVGRDHLWIFADEVKQVLAAGENAQPFEMPRTLAARVVRFHLIDNVRGEPDMWGPNNVKKARFTVRPTGRSEASRSFSFDGEFAQQLPDGSRGQSGSIEGEFTVDVKTAKITRFRAYSQGEAWGQSKYTPLPPAGHFPLVIAMIEVDDQVSKAVPPQAILYAGEYVRPKLDLFR